MGRKTKSTATVVALSLSLLMFGSAVRAEVVMMSSEWAQQACETWNETPVLTDELMKSGWVANDSDRGHKVIQLYRTECGADSRVEIRIGAQGDKAICVYGGKTETTQLVSKSDYLMHAKTTRWQQMGQGKYGPMKAMLLRRLKFKGPKWEAMKNMGPFKSFLLLTGTVGGDASSCPG